MALIEEFKGCRIIWSSDEKGYYAEIWDDSSHNMDTTPLRKSVISVRKDIEKLSE